MKAFLIVYLVFIVLGMLGSLVRARDGKLGIASVGLVAQIGMGAWAAWLLFGLA